MNPSYPSFTFTGRHMLAIMLVFFAVVIAVNVLMATMAGTSWTGFVVRNSYVASQEFNGKVAAARAQHDLGWSASLAAEEGQATLSLTDRQGRALDARSVSIALRSPASDRLDRDIAFEKTAGEFRAALPVSDGLWIVEIDAILADGRTWRETRRIMLRGGSIQ